MVEVGDQNGKVIKTSLENKKQKILINIERRVNYFLELM